MLLTVRRVMSTGLGSGNSSNAQGGAGTDVPAHGLFRFFKRGTPGGSSGVDGSHYVTPIEAARRREERAQDSCPGQRSASAPPSPKRKPGRPKGTVEHSQSRDDSSLDELEEEIKAEEGKKKPGKRKRHSFSIEQLEGIVEGCLAHKGKLPGENEKFPDGIPPPFNLVSQHLQSNRSGAAVFKRASRQAVDKVWNRVCKWLKKNPGQPWQECFRVKGKRRGRKPRFDEAFVKALFLKLEEYSCNTHLEMSLKTARHWLIKRCHEKPEWRRALIKGGGPRRVTHQWISRTLKRYKLSIRHGTTSRSTLPDDWEEQGKLFQERLSFLVHKSPLIRPDDPVQVIPPSLVVNFDQTGMSYVSGRGKTIVKKGQKSVPIHGLKDKRQCTGVTASSASGHILPFQIVLEGKTEASLPAKELRAEAEKEGIVFSLSKNHWSDMASLVVYIDKIVIPYFKSAREEAGVRHDFPAIVILDCWSVHKSQEFLRFMEKRYGDSIHLLFVPARCTGKFQPCDLSLQRAIKLCWSDIGILFMCQQIDEQLEAGVPYHELHIDLRSQAIKQLIPSWAVAVLRHLRKDVDKHVLSGWRWAGLLSVWEKDQATHIFGQAMMRHGKDELWPVKQETGTEAGAAATVEVDMRVVPQGTEPCEVLPNDAEGLEAEDEGEGGKLGQGEDEQLEEGDEAHEARQLHDRLKAAVGSGLTELPPGPAPMREADEALEEFAQEVMLSRQRQKEHNQSQARKKKARQVAGAAGGQGKGTGKSQGGKGKTQVTEEMAAVEGWRFMDERSNVSWVVAKVAWYRTEGIYVGYCYSQDDHPDGLMIPDHIKDDRAKALSWLKRKCYRFPLDEVQSMIERNGWNDDADDDYGLGSDDDEDELEHYSGDESDEEDERATEPCHSVAAAAMMPQAALDHA